MLRRKRKKPMGVQLAVSHCMMGSMLRGKDFTQKTYTISSDTKCPSPLLNWSLYGPELFGDRFPDIGSVVSIEDLPAPLVSELCLDNI